MGRLIALISADGPSGSFSSRLTAAASSMLHLGFCRVVGASRFAKGQTEMADTLEPGATIAFRIASPTRPLSERARRDDVPESALACGEQKGEYRETALLFEPTPLKPESTRIFNGERFGVLLDAWRGEMGGKRRLASTTVGGAWTGTLALRWTSKAAPLAEAAAAGREMLVLRRRR